VTGSCERGNEPSGSIKAGNFVTSWATVGFWKGLCYMEWMSAM